MKFTSSLVLSVRSLFERAPARGAWAILAPTLLLAVLALWSPSLAQGAHHPFAVGANEGAASATGVSGWILALESGYFRQLTGAIRATKQSGAAAWGLIALSFAYGVFHAAGPGHGKAVIASYMLANESALRRGVVISLAAALLQGFVAIAIVGIAAIVLGATAKHMTGAANVIEIASYLGIVVLGAVLVFAKGAALMAAWRGPQSLASSGAPTRFLADDCRADHVHGPDCGHFHAPDPRTLGTGFAWKSALLTVMAAGSRPCSGAILVLVFALAQGIFLAGFGAVLAMSLGTAITTGALATLAVLAKKAAAKYSKADSRRAIIIGRLFETGAALAVMVLGLVLLLASLSGAGRIA